LKRQTIRIARLGVGSVLLLAGVVGGFIPVLQGWILVVLGLSIMAPESERARALLDWAKARLRQAQGSATGNGAGEGR
jgi:hypothetical protein